MMSVCDLCNKTLADGGTSYSPAQMRLALDAGLRPPKKQSVSVGGTDIDIDMNTMMVLLTGQSGGEDAGLEAWRQQVRSDNTPWNLCQACGSTVDKCIATAEDQNRRQAEQEAKRRADQEKRRAQAEMEKKRAEEERRIQEERSNQIQAQRRSDGVCIMCGAPLGFFDRLFRRDRHGKCAEFRLSAAEDPARRDAGPADDDVGDPPDESVHKVADLAPPKGNHASTTDSNGRLPHSADVPHCFEQIEPDIPEDILRRAREIATANTADDIHTQLSPMVLGDDWARAFPYSVAWAMRANKPVAIKYVGACFLKAGERTAGQGNTGPELTRFLRSALRCFELAQSHGEDDWDLHNYRGAALVILAQLAQDRDLLQQAESAFRRAYEIKPEGVISRNLDRVGLIRKRLP